MPSDGPTTDNLNGGYIKAYRSLCDPDRDPFWEQGMRTRDFRPWAAWIYCLTLVNYTDTPSKLLVRGRLMVVDQGEFFITQRALARHVGWESVKPARNFFATLRKLGRIGPQDGPYQVLNWQAFNNIGGRSMGRRGAADGPQGGRLQDLKLLNAQEETQDSPQPAAAEPMPHKPTADERRAVEAEQIVQAYKAKIGRAGDNTFPRARKNVAKLLKAHDAATLTRCIERYALDVAAAGTEPEYRKAAGNFFGRDAVFETYLADDWQAARADTGPHVPFTPEPR